MAKKLVKVQKRKMKQNKTQVLHLKVGQYIRSVSCLCNIVLTALSTLAGDLKWGSSSRARFQPSPVSYIQYHEALSVVTDAHVSLSSLSATPRPIRSHYGPSHQRRWRHSRTQANACDWCKSETDGLSRPKEGAVCFRDHMNAQAHIHPIVQFNTCTGRTLTQVPRR